MCLCLLIIDQLDKPCVNLVTIDLINSFVSSAVLFMPLSLFSLLMMLIIDNNMAIVKSLILKDILD